MNRPTSLIAAIVLLLLCTMAKAATQEREYSGTYTYYSDPSQSYNEAKAAAIQHARMQLLAKEFGTLLTQSTLHGESQKNGHEHSYFMQLNESEVKGEWLGDVKEPVIKETDLGKGVRAFEVTVFILARAVTNEAPDYEVLALRNGKTKDNQSTSFAAGDDLYLYFKAPVDGFVAVYLIDESQTAYCLLPTADDADGLQPVKHGQEYVFLDNVYLTCDDPNEEYNRLYVLFSPKPFTKPVDEQRHVAERLLPRQLSYKDFSHWMVKARSRDRLMGRKFIDITIKNP